MINHPTAYLLEIQRTFRAAPEAVFSALTDPSQMNRWFFGMESGSARVEQDFRVGGNYTVNMFGTGGKAGGCHSEEGARAAPHGEYLEIDPPRKLAFTWISEGFVDMSTVTITLDPTEDGTRLTLRHELPDPSLLACHRDGWTNCLAHLAEWLEQGSGAA